MTPAAPPPPLGELLPWWSILPFALMLACTAVLPLVAPRFWDRNRNKALLSVALGGPVAVAVGYVEPALLGDAVRDYVAFITLLGALFVISGGIVLRGTLAGTPGLNVALLAGGAVLASVVGTTGASMLLVRPVLRANSVRRRRAHVVVFLIFIASNAGGLLTPLGDPPLFLGFLHGVPFFWTLRLWPQWLLVNGVLLAVFYVVDSTVFRREDLERPGDLDKIAVRHQVPIRVVGKHNFVLLAGLVLVLVASGSWTLAPGLREAGMLLLGFLSWVSTPRSLHAEHGFTWSPIVEVAAVFAGIFATMVPALQILNARAAAFRLTEPWQFFWASGALSSFLDNAPTYLTFTAVASGLLGTDPAALHHLVSSARGGALLAAVSLGSVLMGANTYVGNGPNFMVRAIAEASGVRMPSFFGYMAWSGAVLVPLFVAVTWIFLR